MKPLSILLLNQCFYPDHVASSQHLTDLAQGLVAAGHNVTAIAASRGYDNPDLRYPTEETWNGVRIKRIWTPGLGKKAKWRRFVDFAVFWFNATLLLVRHPRSDVTVCLTSPPLISSLGTLVAAIKGGETVPWVMDLNPDEAVAAGWLKAGGLPERIMSALQTWSFHRAKRIVALDRFMAARLTAKGVADELIHVDAPWSHDDVVHYNKVARDSFRARHNVSDKFVVMYSGNHSPCHPLDGLLAAVRSLAPIERIHFMFIGGGSEFTKVQAFKTLHNLSNITCLPYQPLAELSASLSAADLHVVVMGPPFVGIVHPCKIYNILSLGLPFLAICPDQCHLAELAANVLNKHYASIAANDDGASITAAVTAAAERGQQLPSSELQQLAAQYSMAILRPRLVQVIEQCGMP